MEVKGWTLEELAKKLGLSNNSTQMRILRENIKLLFNGSIYPPDTYDKIKDAKVGRPKKPASETSKKPRKT
jgi:transcriptional regulator with XRE-family HTH domain